jgi:hypothetical protein
MIYLDTTIKEFFSKFPSLQNGSINLCEEHSLNINEAKPFITKEKVGILLNPKEECPLTIHIFRDSKFNQEALNFFNCTLQ